MLKKEFKRKDVERMRNLITGNADSSSETQIGYRKKRIEYKEGDTWVEGNKTWTIKNGIKRSLSKLSSIRKESLTPLCCPKCNNVMKKRQDKEIYRIHKHCWDCQVNFEGKLIVRGKHKEYKKLLNTKDSKDYINLIESYLLEAVNTSNEQYVSEKGDVERWVGGIDKKKMIKDIVKNANKARKKLKNVSND